MESRMENIHLSGEEEEELVLDDGSIQSNDVQVDLCLVGRFLTDQQINFNLMRSRMAAIWRPGKGVFMNVLGDGRYIFQFFHPLDVKRLMDGGPWTFNNVPLILHRLHQGEFPMRVPLDILQFWVQIHDLPAGYITEGIGRQIRNFIGVFTEYDATNTGSIWKQYMRIRVGIDVTKPLKRGKKIKKPDGTSFTVNFKYERLHIFCFVCGRVGHSERFCDDIFSMNPTEIKEWGVWLRADDHRGSVSYGDKWLRKEGEGASGDVGKKGEEIFSFGNPANNWGSTSMGSGESGIEGIQNRSDKGGIVLRDSAQDFGRMGNGSTLPIHTGKDKIVGDERKRRRGEEKPNKIPLSDISNNVLSLSYHEQQEHLDNHIFSML